MSFASNKYESLYEGLEPVTLHMQNIPHGFESHTIFGYLMMASESGVDIIIPWGADDIRIMRSMNHTIIGIEFDKDRVLDDLGANQ